MGFTHLLLGFLHLIPALFRRLLNLPRKEQTRDSRGLKMECMSVIITQECCTYMSLELTKRVIHVEALEIHRRRSQRGEGRAENTH